MQHAESEPKLFVEFIKHSAKNTSQENQHSPPFFSLLKAYTAANRPFSDDVAGRRKSIVERMENKQAFNTKWQTDIEKIKQLEKENNLVYRDENNALILGFPISAADKSKFQEFENQLMDMTEPMIQELQAELKKESLTKEQENEAKTLFEKIRRGYVFALFSDIEVLDSKKSLDEQNKVRQVQEFHHIFRNAIFKEGDIMENISDAFKSQFAKGLNPEQFRERYHKVGGKLAEQAFYDAYQHLYQQKSAAELHGYYLAAAGFTDIEIKRKFDQLQNEVWNDKWDKYFKLCCQQSTDSLLIKLFDFPDPENKLQSVHHKAVQELSKHIKSGDEKYLIAFIQMDSSSNQISDLKKLAFEKLMEKVNKKGWSQPESLTKLVNRIAQIDGWTPVAKINALFRILSIKDKHQTLYQAKLQSLVQLCELANQMTDETEKALLILSISAQAKVIEETYQQAGLAFALTKHLQFSKADNTQLTSRFIQDKPEGYSPMQAMNKTWRKSVLQQKETIIIGNRNSLSPQSSTVKPIAPTQSKASSMSERLSTHRETKSSEPMRSRAQIYSVPNPHSWKPAEKNDNKKDKTNINDSVETTTPTLGRKR